jgi:opacity protein-like surface antigen
MEDGNTGMMPKRTKPIPGVALAAVLAALANAQAVAAEGQSLPWMDEPVRIALTPYGWGPSTEGTIGVDGNAAKLDLPIGDALEILEACAFLGAEVQKGRWGLLLDGTYMNLNDAVSTPGAFFELVEVDYKQATLDAGLFYRVYECDRGWLDLLAGARYMYFSTELGFTPDYAAAGALSEQLVDRTVSAVENAVESRASAKADLIADELAGHVADTADELADAARDRILDLAANVDDRKLAAILQNGGNRLADGSRGTGGQGLLDATREAFGPRMEGKVRDRIADIDVGGEADRLAKALKLAVADRVRDRVQAAGPGIEGNPGAIRDAVRDAIREEAGAAVAELRKTASSDVSRALDSAEDALTKEITDGMTAAANADVSESVDWVDFYVGLRGRWTLWRPLYAGVRADVGGFGLGASSDLAWQAFGGLGYQFSDHVALEAGWRHLDIDYDNGTLLLDLAYSGATAGLSVTF